MIEEFKPTEITRDDLDNICNKLLAGDFDLKPRPCIGCNKQHLPNYGYVFGECDECYLSRFPKDKVEAFCRSFFE